MKKWISYILLLAFLFTAIPSFNVSAAETDWSGELKTNENNINITLSAPQTKTEGITSMHFRIYISIENGKMDAPTFQFASTVKSKVADAAAILDNSSNYILDIILSGTKDQDIFQTAKQADIGTVLLHPTSNTYKITANFTGITASSKEPAIEYVTSNNQFAEEVPLVNTKLVIIEKTGTSGSNSSSGSNGSSNSINSGGSSTDYTSVQTSTPVPSVIPSATQLPLVTPASSTVPSVTQAPSAAPSNTPEPTSSATVSPATTVTPVATETPTVSQEPIPFNIQPKLSTSIKKGTNVVKFNWNRVTEADGYIIYRKTGSGYKNIKTISNPEKISCSIKMSYATSYLFRIRAFKISEDGSRTYGKYSSIVKVTTAPTKVKGLKVKRIKNSRVSLSWRKVKRASGYQIFISNKKNGKYTRVKVLKKGFATSTTIKQKVKKTYYYKVRAYKTNANKKYVYGNFSKSLTSKS